MLRIRLKEKHMVSAGSIDLKLHCHACVCCNNAMILLFVLEPFVPYTSTQTPGLFIVRICTECWKIAKNEILKVSIIERIILDIREQSTPSQAAPIRYSRLRRPNAQTEPSRNNFAFTRESRPTLSNKIPALSYNLEPSQAPSSTDTVS